MRRYHVMLVDDEEDVIRVIMRKINWEALGLSLPVYAQNGVEALELAEEQQPDIVLTDIKMPYMDGLELSRRLKELYPNIRIIIFSGFDDFEYAREAIRIEVEEYVLKPVNAQELTRVFEKVRDGLDKEYDEQQNIRMLQEYYDQSLPIFREGFYGALIEGKIDEEQIASQMRDYRIELAGPWYCAAVLHTGSRSPAAAGKSAAQDGAAAPRETDAAGPRESGADAPREPGADASHKRGAAAPRETDATEAPPAGMTPVLLSVSMRKSMEERLGEAWDGRFFSYLGNTVMIAQMKEAADVSRFTDECDRFCRLMWSAHRAIVTIGIGTVTRELPGLSESYRGARRGVSYRIIYGSGKAINIAEIAPKESDSISPDEGDELQEIIKMIRMDDREHLPEKISTYIRENGTAPGSIQNYRFFVMDLVSSLYRFSRNNGLTPEQIFGENDDMYRQIQQLDPVELTAWMKDVCGKMQTMLREKRTDTSRSFVKNAIEYVADNYASDELSVESICSHLGVSTAYFSTVFKRETGKTFINYLTEYRMKKAVELLLAKDEKTYVIAREVGYSDPNYFSYVFKKQFGVSPSRYRASRAN